MKICVLGGGNGSYAAAADLAEAGHDVNLWRRDVAALQAVIETGTITLKDAIGTRDVPINMASENIAEALNGAELIVAPVPATAQEDVAGAIAPHLVDGQVVFLPPGTFGSYVMARIVREAGNKADVAWAETGTLPYLARKHGDREVQVTVRAVRLPTGVYPCSKQAYAIDVIRKAYPSVQGCGDALSGALMNAGPIIHPPLMVMNAAPLQHFERWDIHNEGTQQAVRDVTSALDQERMAIREALGYGAPHYPLSDHYDNDRWMYGEAHKKLVDSGDWREHIDLYNHRYISEDTEIGLSLLASAARYAGVTAPIAHGLLAIVGGFLGRSLIPGSRSLETLDLAQLSFQDFCRRLKNGE